MTASGEPPEFGRFFLPGPTEVHPEVLAAQARPVIGHRGPAIEGLMEKLQEGLKSLFRTDRPVFVSTSSATGLMEAGIRNGARERVLCLVNGAFSARFAAIARSCGREVETLEVPWGRAHDPDEVRARLEEGGFDAVTVVHSETSTGVLNPVEEIAAVVADYDDALLLVDSVSGLGGADVRTDEWALDYVLTGSQKALAVPPGLAFAAASEGLLSRAGTLPGRGTYFDLPKFRSKIDALQTPNTPAVTLLYALEVQLERIEAEGVDARLERHRRMAERCWARVEAMREDLGVEVEILADRPHRSPTVSCVVLPDGVSGRDVVRTMADRGFVIGAGYGKMKDEAVRIGHMGDHTVRELDRLLDVLAETLEQHIVEGAQSRA